MENQEQVKNKNIHITDLLKKMNRFLTEEKSEDILIIKAHLLCEYYINQLLLLRGICSANEVESLTFHEKIGKVFNLQNKEDKLTYDFTNRLNKLRNKVGHELEYTLSESDVDSLGYVQGKDYILEKYEYETDLDRLRNILRNIVISTALLLINGVNAEKARATKPLNSPQASTTSSPNSTQT